MDGNTILGWWASGAAIASSSPDYTVSVPNTASFSVYPGDFKTHTGNWYRMVSLSQVNGTAFSVVDPQLDIRVEDTTVNVDVTDKWVPTGDDLQFRIDTNLLQMIQRAGVTSVPITIKVQTPQGTTLTSLVNRNGAVTQIDSYPLTTTPEYTGAIWSTSNRDMYSPGTYQVWAECNVNSMKDNYGETGKTISSQVSLLNQDQNPLIGDKGYVTNPITTVTTPTAEVFFSTVSKTPIPETTTYLPTTVITTTPAVTTLEMVSEAATVPLSTPTKSPGFGPILVMVAMICGMVLSFYKIK
jgi:hypothetical protein